MPKLPIKKCLLCGKDFERKSDYCSESCHRKAYYKKYYSRPGVKQRRLEYAKKYSQTPEGKECKKQYAKRYRQLHGTRMNALNFLYRQQPGIKEYDREYRKYHISPFHLEADYTKYMASLYKRFKDKQKIIDEQETLKQSYINNVAEIIDGGIEIKIAERLKDKKVNQDETK